MLLSSAQQIIPLGEANRNQHSHCREKMSGFMRHHRVEGSGEPNRVWGMGVGLRAFDFVP